MDENYYGISRLQFDTYFENLSMKHKDCIMDLLNILSTRIQFTLKKLSTQFHIMKGTEPFVAFGFRKRKTDNYYFIEFYSKFDIDDIRISKKTAKEVIVKNKKMKYIINLIKIKECEKIDNQIINWIEEGYKLI
ncbi:hypothetical protein R83H12_01039 [Fibrobacteria bacterium R8-3-H12]